MQLSQKLPKVVLILGLTCVMASVPAIADPVLYSNGPITNCCASFLISNEPITDSFTLSQSSAVTGADFSIFITGDPDTLYTVDYAITTAPLGGTIEASGTVNPIGSFIGYLNSPGDYWDVYDESFSISSLNLSAGTYWFELQNAVSAEGNFVAWENNNGPSEAFSPGGNLNGSVGAGSNSEAFDLYGTTSSATPEPSSFLLLGSGLLGLTGLVRRRSRQQLS